MRKAILASGLAFALAAPTGPGPAVAGPADDPAEASVAAALERSLLEAVNETRRDHGLDVLRQNAALSRAARAYAHRMAELDFFDHVDPDGDLLPDRLDAVGYPYRTAGENLAAGRARPDRVVADWMASDGHRYNLLRDDVAELGLGYAVDQERLGPTGYRHYWVMLVGSQREDPDDPGWQDATTVIELPEPPVDRQAPAADGDVDVAGQGAEAKPPVAEPKRRGLLERLGVEPMRESLERQWEDGA